MRKIPYKQMLNTNSWCDMSDFCIISTGDALCYSHACQHTFQLFFFKAICILSKIPGLLIFPDGLSLLVAVNTAKSMIVSEHIKVYIFPFLKLERIKARGFCRPD
jgi:hypothetical protein